MTEKEKKYVERIWDDLTKEQQEYFNSLPKNRKGAWLRYYAEDEAMAAAADRQNEKQKQMVCRTCKFAGKLWSGKNASDFTAGSCEKYETKPTDVYFDAAKCPKYQEK